MIPLEEAIRRLTAKARVLGTETVPVRKSLDRVLREDLVSPLSIPPFSKSAMDGYAVRSVDVKGAGEKCPVELRVLEDLPAGNVGRHRVTRGTATRIMTGATLPQGADAVVMVEYSRRTKQGVRILKEAPKGKHVAPAGEDVRKGQRVLRAGTLIGPAEMGMIASMGRSAVKVGIKPKVGVLSTGSEVLPPGRAMKPGHIYDSNGASLTGLALSSGAEARFLGIAPDRKGALERKIEGAGNFDVLILSGGVSIGDYDLVKDILLEMGVKRLFWKVRVKPGKPVFAGMQNKRFILGLPGNPVSSMVTFQLLARPLLDVMAGRSEVGLRRGSAFLLEGRKLKPGRRKFLRGSLQEAEGRLYVRLFADQESGILRSMVESNVLVDVPGEVERLKTGSMVKIVYLG